MDVLARLFNTCIGAGLGFGFGLKVRRARLVMELFDVDRATALAIITAVGAVIGLIWGKAIWASIDRKFHAGR